MLAGDDREGGGGRYGCYLHRWLNILTLVSIETLGVVELHQCTIGLLPSCRTNVSKRDCPMKLVRGDVLTFPSAGRSKHCGT